MIETGLDTTLPAERPDRLLPGRTWKLIARPRDGQGRTLILTGGITLG
ncbi:hypothetical protein ACIRBZ_38245 [Streptomyces sp. NPDC094038]